MAQLEQGIVRATSVLFEEVGLLIGRSEFGYFTGHCDADTDGDGGVIITAISIRSEHGDDAIWDVPKAHPVFKMLSDALYQRYAEELSECVYPDGAPSFDPVREYGTLWGSP